MDINADLIAVGVIFLSRMLLPLTILKWPLGGILLAILADTADVMILEQWPNGPIKDASYHNAGTKVVQVVSVDQSAPGVLACGGEPAENCTGIYHAF